MVNLQEGLLPGLSQTFRVKLKTMQRLNHRSFGSCGIGFALKGVFWSLLALSLASQLLPGQVTQVLADGPVVQAKTAPAPAKGQPSVVLITLDGLPATFLRDPAVSLPNLRRLAQQGVAAEGMIVANPSVTWPNHTTLITGVYPATHGVLFNGVLQRPGLGLPPKTEAKKDGRELVAVPTLFDFAKHAGLATAGINWPCTRNIESVDDNMPDVPEFFESSTPGLINDLKQNQILTEELIKNFYKYSGTIRDDMWTAAATYIIRHRMPQFMTIHLLNVDGVHHKYGPRTPGGDAAVAYIDTCLGRILDAIESSGNAGNTTIIVTADHGFISIPQSIRPNVKLKQAGLLTTSGNRVDSARAYAIPEGGIAMVFLTVPESKAADRQKVVELFKDSEGILSILQPAEFAAYGLPDPADHPGMADLILVAKDGYGFSAVATGDETIVESDTTLGTHGFLSTNPKMNAILVMAGRGIRTGASFGTENNPGIVRNVDVAPTIAHLLKLKLPQTDGRVLTEVLTPQE